MILLLVILLALTNYCCASVNAPKPAVEAPEESPAPDLSRVAVFVGYDGLAHGCPISPDIILTARHVVLNHKSVFLGPAEGSEYAVRVAGQVGSAKAVAYSDTVDLGLMQLSFKVQNPYIISMTHPIVGDKLWLRDFDHNRRKMFQDKDVKTKVITVLPHHLLIDEYGLPGSSGSCVLNERGEVVGIYVAILASDSSFSDAVGMVVTVDNPPMDLVISVP